MEYFRNSENKKISRFEIDIAEQIKQISIIVSIKFSYFRLSLYINAPVYIVIFFNAGLIIDYASIK